MATSRVVGIEVSNESRVQASARIWLAVAGLPKEIAVKRGYAHDTPYVLTLVAHPMGRGVRMLNEYDWRFESADSMRNNVSLDGRAWLTVKTACSDGHDFIKWPERDLARNPYLDFHQSRSTPTSKENHFQTSYRWASACWSISPVE